MTTTLPLKVASRFLKISESIGDPREHLREYELAIQQITQPADKVAWAKDQLEQWLNEADYTTRRNWPGMAQVTDITYNCMFAVKRGAPKISHPGHSLFLSLLQTYTLPPTLRKKVEIASRTYLKTKAPNPPKNSRHHGLGYIAFYEKFITALHAHLAVAKEAIAKGKKHSLEGEGATKINVGDFVLVNTGGFSAKQMDEVADVMKKVTTLAKNSGLGAVCYGEVQITNTISKGNVLAFYLIAKDELFVRANVKATVDTVQTVLHELGHRYEKMFLKRPSAMATLYNILSGQERKREDHRKGKKPDPGTTLESKGKTYVVRKTLPAGRSGYKVHLEVEGEPGSFTVGLDAFWELKGDKARGFDEKPDYIGFVTEYAKRGGPSENFAEMFAYYCLGRLPVLQSVPFEELVFGDGKTASERLAMRVAARSTLT